MNERQDTESRRGGADRNEGSGRSSDDGNSAGGSGRNRSGDGNRSGDNRSGDSRGRGDGRGSGNSGGNSNRGGRGRGGNDNGRDSGRNDGGRSDSGRSDSDRSQSNRGGRGRGGNDRNDGDRNDGGRGDSGRGDSDRSQSNRGGRGRGGSGDGGGAEAAAAAPKPKIGDSRPAPANAGGDSGESGDGNGGDSGGGGRSRNRSGGNRQGGQGSGRRQNNQRGQGNNNQGGQQRGGGQGGGQGNSDGDNQGGDGKRRRRRGGRGRGRGRQPVEGGAALDPVELDEATLAKRRGKERDGKPIGRYLMGVHVQDQARHIAILEGRSLIEYYVSRPTDDATQIHGNIYLGRVQNVLPGMEAAFIDIATPKNAVLYHGDLNYDPKDYEGKAPPRIEQVLRPKELILCQVTKNPIAHKGARLTQEISLPGRFVVLMPNNSTYGISKRLPEKERKRLRKVLDEVKPKQHGVIVRTAAENVTAEELQRDVSRLLNQWERISELAQDRQSGARLLYREPDLAVRLIREEFTKEYRGVVIDDRELYEEVHGYVSSVTPALSDRIEYFDTSQEKLSLFERHHVHEQFHKALDKKVWLPSGGSLIIEHTEALTVIDVNTGKNVGKSSLEDTVFQNNLEAAKEVARQLRLRDIGGIIVIDFVDMENRKNRARVTDTFREALARDKTRTQVYDISDLGLVEMTRKRIGEGLLESVSGVCPTCEGRGAILEEGLL